MVALPPGVERIVDAIYPVQRQAVAAQLSALEVRLFFGATAWQLLLLFSYYASGAAATVRGLLERRLHSWLAVSAAWVAISYAGYALLMLPFDWYGGFTVPHAFGLSRELPSVWWHDWALSSGIDLIVLLVVALLFTAAVRRFGNRWVIAAAIALAPLVLFADVVFPIYVAPLFNRYTPLPNTPLTQSILALAAREGISASAVYEYDMSRQTTEGNAYVAGIGAAARIAVGDNLLHDLRPDEVLYVVAHEMGHYKLHHIWWGSLYGWLGGVVIIVLLALCGDALVRAGPRNARALADPAALALLAALLVCFGLIGAPAANAVSRSIEHAADAFAADRTDLGNAGIRAFARLGAENLSELHPKAWVAWYFYTHPPLDERIAYAAAHRFSSGHGGLTVFPK